MYFNPVEQEIYLKYALNASALSDLINSCLSGNIEAVSEAKSVLKTFCLYLPTFTKSLVPLANNDTSEDQAQMDIDNLVPKPPNRLYMTTKKQEFALNVCIKIILSLKLSLREWLSIVQDDEKAYLLVLGMFNYTSSGLGKDAFWRICPVLFHRFVVRVCASRQDVVAETQFGHASEFAQLLNEKMLFSEQYLEQTLAYARKINKDSIIVFSDLAWFYYKRNVTEKASWVLETYDAIAAVKKTFDAEFELNVKELEEALKWARGLVSQGSPQMDAALDLESLLERHWKDGSSYVIYCLANRLVEEEEVCKQELFSLLDNNRGFNIDLLARKKQIVYKNVVNILYLVFQSSMDAPDLPGNWTFASYFNEEALRDYSWVGGKSRITIDSAAGFKIVFEEINYKDYRNIVLKLILARACSDAGDVEKAVFFYDQSTESLSSQTLLEDMKNNTIVYEKTIIGLLSLPYDQFMESIKNRAVLKMLLEPFVDLYYQYHYGSDYLQNIFAVVWRYQLGLQPGATDDLNIMSQLITLVDAAENRPVNEVLAARTDSGPAVKDNRRIKEFVHCLFDFTTVINSLRSAKVSEKKVSVPAHNDAFKSYMFRFPDVVKDALKLLRKAYEKGSVESWELILILGEISLCAIPDKIPSVFVSNCIIDFESTQKEVRRRERAYDVAIELLYVILNEFDKFQYENTRAGKLYWTARLGYVHRKKGNSLTAFLYLIHALTECENLYRTISAFRRPEDAFCKHLLKYCVELAIELKRNILLSLH